MKDASRKTAMMSLPGVMWDEVHTTRILLYIIDECDTSTATFSKKTCPDVPFVSLALASMKWERKLAVDNLYPLQLSSPKSPSFLCHRHRKGYLVALGSTSGMLWQWVIP